MAKFENVVQRVPVGYRNVKLVAEQKVVAAKIDRRMPELVRTD